MLTKREKGLAAGSVRTWQNVPKWEPSAKLGLWEEFLPLFIRTPSFTTRGIDEDEAEDDTDFGTDVDIGAEDAAEERGFTLVGAT